MTYSQRVKEELCEAKLSCDDCVYFLVYGMLLFGGRSDDVLFANDDRKITDCLAQHIVELTGVIAGSEDEGLRTGKKHRSYSLAVEKTDDVDQFYHLFAPAIAGEFPQQIFTKNGVKSCCMTAFLRGAFLACGVIVNPVREYHFEFKMKKEELSKGLFALLPQPLGFKETRRKGNAVLYLKGSEPIEEALTWLGAYKSALDLMNIKIEKEVRNNVNRVTNCETANISKTVKASVKQVGDIRFLLEKKGMGYLSDDLKEVAQARLENPEMSLSELCKILPSGISRSGLNHRLTRLCKMAEELRAAPTVR